MPRLIGPRFEIAIKASEKVPYGKVILVMSAARAAGIQVLDQAREAAFAQKICEFRDGARGHPAVRTPRLGQQELFRMTELLCGGIVFRQLRLDSRRCRMKTVDLTESPLRRTIVSGKGGGTIGDVLVELHFQLAISPAVNVADASGKPMIQPDGNS